MSFETNLKIVAEDFKDAMDLQAGKTVKVSDIFTALQNLSDGKYQNLGEMYKAHNFNQQNVVYTSVRTLLKDLGTPVDALSKSKRKTKLSGTEFALRVLEKKAANAV